MATKKSFRILLCVMVYLVCCISLRAQIKSATITGSVIDPSGAVVSDAEVAIVNEDTGVATSAKTSESGSFTVPYLAAGRYSVTINKVGFAVYKKTEIAVGTDETVRVNAQLRTGAITETVVVHAESAQLQTDTSTVEGAVNSRTIEDIPNPTNNPLRYAILQAGVTPRAAMQDSTSPTSFGIGWGSRRQFSAFNVDGGTAFTNDIQLDGLSIQGSAWNEATVLPNPDALQEVRVLSNNFSAEYGRGQGIVLMTTKTGTNAFHGGVNYTNRNEAFNANSYANDAQKTPKGPFKVNQFGGSVGGPILKDKLFFFVSYEHLIHSDAANWLLTVPTALERTGNFSQTKIQDNSGNPVPVQLYDPFTVSSVSGNNYQHPLIPNATIVNPDPRAMIYYTSFPMPNRVPTNAGDLIYNNNNFFSQGTRQYRRNSLNSRVDFHWGRNSIYGTGGFEQGSIKTPRPFGANSPFYQPPTNGWSSELDRDLNPYGAIGDTIALSPTLVLDVRYGITRVHNDSISGVNSAFDYASFGMPSKVLPVVPLPGAALDILFPGHYSDLSLGSYQQKRERQTNHLLAGSITKVLNRWTLKGGSEFRVYLSNYTDFEDAGAMAPGGWNGSGGNFTSEWTDANGGGSSLNTTNVQNGFGGASTMLGAGAFVIRPGFIVRPAFAQKLFALYTQNDWRATNKLTLNFGLRWEVQPGPTDRFNRISSIDFNAANPYLGQGKYVFAGTNGYSRNLWDTELGDFQPRFGAAYSLTPTTVLRGGYGLTYLPTNTGYYNGPFTYGTGNFSASTQGKIFGVNPNGTPVGHFWDAAPTIVVPEAGAVQTPSMYSPGGTYMFDRHNYKNGHVGQWNLFIERQFPHSWFASVGYVGSTSKDLQNGRFPINNIQLIPGTQLQTWRTAWIASNGTDNPAFDQVPNPAQPTSGPLLPFNDYLGNATIQRYQAMQPYPMLGNMTVQGTNGFANYNALQTHVSHAFSGGLQLAAHYTWSKSLTYSYTELQGNQGFADASLGANSSVDLQNCTGGYRSKSCNLNVNRGLSEDEPSQRFLAVLTYDLPIGRGKLLDPANGFVRAVVGNWTVGSVITLQNGLPNAVGFGDSLNGRSDVTNEPVEVPKALQRWYDGNTSVTLPDGRKITPCGQCFLKYNPDRFAGRVVTLPNGSTAVDQLWYGNGSRNYGYLRGPRYSNVDMTINRQFKVREGIQFELAANFTNALNHANFMNTGYNFGAGTTAADGPAGSGLFAGMNSNNNFGTHGLSTFEPRQITFIGKLRF